MELSSFHQPLHKPIGESLASPMAANFLADGLLIGLVQPAIGQSDFGTSNAKD
jgi:hypothetical protein